MATTVEVSKRLINVEEYYLMADVGILKEKNIELINGEIINMSPSGSEHAACLYRLNAIFSNILGDQYIKGSQNPIRIDEYNEPEPDFVILKHNPTFYSKAHPGPSDVLLLIEVADSSLNYDSILKKELYAKAGITDYWIIDLQNKRIEAHQNPKAKVYELNTIYLPGELIKNTSLNFEMAVNDILGPVS